MERKKTIVRTKKKSAPVKKLAPKVTLGSDGPERIQKILARCGFGSRRKCEELILEGVVSVNGKLITELGSKADPQKDKIKVRGKLLFTEVDPVYIAFYKPGGVISALSDPEGRPHIGEYLSAIQERVVPIGRMDFTSEGLILLTNDGKIANQILKSKKLKKTYMVKIKGHPEQKELDALKRGIFSSEGVVRFSNMAVDQKLKSKSWLRLEVEQGSSLDLRELLNRRGLMVDKIVRYAIGDLTIDGLRPGLFRRVSARDFAHLLEE
jgi:23S rRNA pseudouridine2605 synthase